MKNYLRKSMVISLVLCILTGCGNSTGREAGNPVSLAESNNRAQYISQEQEQREYSNAERTNYFEAYEKIMAYKTEDYGKQSVADFNAALRDSDYAEFAKAYEIVLAECLPDDENYDFIMQTLAAAVSEIYYEDVEKSKEFAMISYVKKETRPVQPLPGEEWILERDPIYNFGFYGCYYIQYTIPDPYALTVAERDDAIQIIQVGMQEYVDTLSEAELMDSNIKTLLTEQANELAKSVTSDRIRVSCEIDDVEIHCEDMELFF